MEAKRPRRPAPVARHGVARVLSKLGIASRTEAGRWVADGRVRVNGAVVRDADFPVRQGVDTVRVDDRDALPVERQVVMLNKPRGLVTTARDEQGRDTVYRCLDGSGLPWLAPVGRLDKASEGLLLFCNDPAWAARMTDPATGPAKTYHVQISPLPSARLLAALEGGVVDAGERLAARSVRPLRTGTRNAWVEVILDGGRNRQIRRMFAAVDVSVLRLVRVAIGTLDLGELPKGGWRALTPAEVAAL